MESRIVSTKVVKSVNGWEIEKTVEQKYNCFGEKKGKPETFFDCVQEDVICESFGTLKAAMDYCKAH